MLGGGLGEDLSGTWIAVAASLGVLALCVLAVAQGTLGQRLVAGHGGVLAGPLGRLGATRIASWVVATMMVGWFGVNTGVGGAALGELLSIPRAAGVVVFGAVLLAVVAGGLGTLSWAALVAGLATVAIGGYGSALALEQGGGAAAAGGGPGAALAGATLVVGYGAAFAMRSPDFTHDLARPRHVVWCALAGLALPMAAFIAIGAALQRATGTWNLADVLVELDAAPVAQAFLAVGFAGSVMTNLHSGGEAVGEGSGRAGRLGGLVLIGVAGAALAIAGLADRMLDYLALMALAAPGLVLVSVLYWTSGHRTDDKWGIPALSAWAIGFGVGVGVALAGSPLALPVAIALTGGAYFLFTAILARRGRISWEIDDDHRP